MSLDLAPAIRTAVIEAPFAGDLALYHGEPAVFTRRPVPPDAERPFVLVNPPAAISDMDALASDRPLIMRDVLIYGWKGAPGAADDQTRVVEQIGFEIRDLFHRQKFGLRPDGFSVIDIRATGPIPAPADDEVAIGRVVSLTIRLRRIGS